MCGFLNGCFAPSCEEEEERQVQRNEWKKWNDWYMNQGYVNRQKLQLEWNRKSSINDKDTRSKFAARIVNNIIKEQH